MNIAENLKRLRHGANITQEELAARLNVSPQAVSKWERGDGYPDITILPALAAYFDVTLDELVGMSAYRDRARIDAALQKVRDFYAGEVDGDGQLERGEQEQYDRATLLIGELSELSLAFPHDFSLRYHLANLCRSAALWLESSELYGKFVALMKSILDDCRDNTLTEQLYGQRIRAAAQSALIEHYTDVGEKEKALSLAEELSPYELANRKMYIYSGEDAIRAAQEVIHGYPEQFRKIVWRIAGVPAYSPGFDREAVLALYDKIGEMYDLIFDRGDLDAQQNLMMVYHYQACAVTAAESDRERCLDYVELAVKHAVLCDTQPAEHKCASILVDRIEYDVSVSLPGARRSSQVLEYFNATPQLDAVRGDARFAAAEEKLRAVIESDLPPQNGVQ